MKSFLLVSLLALLSVTSAIAVKIPKGIYRVADIDKARAAAAEKEVAVAYILFPEKIKIS